MKGDKYPKILAKIQVSTIIFHMQDIRRNDFPKYMYGDAMLVPMGANMAAGNQKKRHSCFVLQ